MPTKEDTAAWDKLCLYVKRELLRYPDTAKFPRAMALRLRGLARGQHMANNSHKPQAEYSYDTLYYTAVYCRSRIIRYLEENETRIQDESHRINLIMRFLEGEVNNVHLKLQANAAAKKRMEATELPAQQHTGAPYKPKTKPRQGLEKLW